MTVRTEYQEMELQHGGQRFRVRFEYDPGERQWFDAKAGVGCPGYGPSVYITEVNSGDGWQPPENYPQFNVEACEAEVLDRLEELEYAERMARNEPEYDAAERPLNVREGGDEQ